MDKHTCHTCLYCVIDFCSCFSIFFLNRGASKVGHRTAAEGRGSFQIKQKSNSSLTVRHFPALSFEWSPAHQDGLFNPRKSDHSLLTLVRIHENIHPQQSDLWPKPCPLSGPEHALHLLTLLLTPVFIPHIPPLILDSQNEQNYLKELSNK